MRFFRFLLLGVWACSFAARADLPDYRAFPAEGARLLLWVASERGRAEPELQAAQQLAERGTAVWSLDPVSAFFLPQLPSSMDSVPAQDMADWLRAAQAGGQRVVVYAVSRAAVPVLRAAALLQAVERQQLCVLLMYPNLYTVAEPLAAPDFLEVGSLSGLQVRVLQPRRSAATPWLPGLLDHLEKQGASTSQVILENLREGYWMRETPTEFEMAESRRMDAMLLRELNDWGCQ
ncbi:MAG: hypothetical protein CVU23_05375 [Betaproteobacteria bacterium HGW-Betaproteobacteria-17]|nr:MAG: hypothetical protein CVU23_05375 [Betaproteobacteria bacterium HGW-Betaproteobacteria-17]